MVFSVQDRPTRASRSTGTSRADPRAKTSRTRSAGGGTPITAASPCRAQARRTESSAMDSGAASTTAVRATQVERSTAKCGAGSASDSARPPRMAFGTPCEPRAGRSRQTRRAASAGGSAQSASAATSPSGTQIRKPCAKTETRRPQAGGRQK